MSLRLLVAILILFAVIGVATSKFLFVINAQNNCPLGAMARDCKDNADFNDHFLALRGISRAVLSRDAIFTALFSLLVAIVSLTATKWTLISSSLLILLASFRVKALHSVAAAKRPLLSWIELHEGGNPTIALA